MVGRPRGSKGEGASLEALVDPAAPSPFRGLLEEAQSPDPTAYPADDDAPDLAATLATEPVPAALLPADDPSADTLPPGRAPTKILEPPAATALPHPVALVGNYELLNEIGSGGMATVHRGRQPSLNRDVAIKSLRPEYAGDDEVVRRFEREAASLAQLQHGNVVSVLDVVSTSDGGRHIVMELVEGVDGFDLLEAAGSLPPAVVALIALQTARGLEHAHARGIVHRDIKPSNLFISRRGEVKLMDFGIARDPARNSELTQIGLSVGTPEYMAPEQIRGAPVDGRADQFALGIVLYEFLTGAPPWPARSGRSVAIDVLQKPFAPLAPDEVPSELARIVSRCLAKAPEARWPDTRALRSALETYVHEQGPADPYGVLIRYLAERGFASVQDAGQTAARTPRRLEAKEERALAPIAVASALALVLIVAAAVLTATSPVGASLPEARPRPGTSTP